VPRGSQCVAKWRQAAPFSRTAHIPHVQLEAVMHQGLDVEPLCWHNAAAWGRAGDCGGGVGGERTVTCRHTNERTKSGCGEKKGSRQPTNSCPWPPEAERSWSPVCTRYKHSDRYRGTSPVSEPRGRESQPTHDGRCQPTTKTTTHPQQPDSTQTPTHKHALCDVLVRHLLEDGGLARIVQTQHQNACLLLGWLQLACNNRQRGGGGRVTRCVCRRKDSQTAMSRQTVGAPNHQGSG
jgi:hypothetical protein